ncbi:hypothetical protein JJQ72_11320 [Paenibacillus sp. F411]|uniref:hypothetical protein n=1 Tax=Paenibacillus sp. F411 TaxID=2820239 RepID=UPI001AAF02DB|nr:hypothetical protein [Paenibacillus sp. F411]MBO2944559.1 hypothetical protein [Paenibacillus sp. F411]
MSVKKVTILLLCMILMLPFFRNMEMPEVAAEGIQSISLKESPYSLGEGWTMNETFIAQPPYALAIGRQEYIAVGPNGTIMKSKNGRDWKALSSFGNYHLTAIEWDGSKYVMFGSNTKYARNAGHTPSEAFMSKDGLTWSKLSFEPGEPIVSLIWGKGQFVAVGRNHVYTSSNGEAWTKTLQLSASYGSRPVKYVNGTYFILGHEEKKVYMSKDGVKWTAKPLDTKAGINDLVWTGKHYLGVGNGIYTSKDGVSWTKQSKSPSGVSLQSIYKSGSNYMAIGFGSNFSYGEQVLYTSSNGTTWSKKDISHVPYVYTMYPVTGGFAGVGSNNMDGGLSDGIYSIFTSDGKKWSYRLAGSSDFSAIATNGKRTVAVGLNGSVIYTLNGTQWNSSNPFSFDKKQGRAHLFDVAWGANRFVAVGNGGVYVSSDGASWKFVRVPFKHSYGGLRKIAWTGTFFVASDQVNGVFTSKDGLKWTQAGSVSSSGTWLTSMVWDGKRVIAAFQIYNNGKQYTKIMQSTNGTAWTELARLNVSEVHIAWNGKSYIAVYPYDATKMWVSRDGKMWSKAGQGLDYNDRFEFVTAFDGQFFAFNDSVKEINGEYMIYNSYYLSKDGVKWEESRLPDADSELDRTHNRLMTDGVKAHGKYIFVGVNGQIMTKDPIH